MSSRKKITAVSWILGGLAMACVGATQAYASAPQGGCSHDSQGNTVCSYKSESSSTSKDGTYHLQQKQDCTTVSRDRVDTPSSGVGRLGTTHVGPTVGCSNSAPLPKGYTLPAHLG